MGFEFIMSNGGLPSAATYPFDGYTGTNAPMDTPACNATLEAEVGLPAQQAAAGGDR